MKASLPSYVNGVISSPWVNAGAMTNKGMEFTLNTVNINKKDFMWRSGLTISFNKNEITKLYTETAGLSGIINTETYTYSEVGQPAAQFYGYKVIGIFTKEDDFYKKDSYGNYILDKNGERTKVAIPKDKNIAGVSRGHYNMMLLAGIMEILSATIKEMRVGPSQSVYRNRLQTITSCVLSNQKVVNVVCNKSEDMVRYV